MYPAVGVERYANLPRPPELLTLQPVPEVLGENPLLSFGLMLFMWVYVGVPGLAVVWIISWFSESAALIARVVLTFICLAISVMMIFEVVSPHFRAVAANGERPRENARRQEAFEEARTAALKAAEPEKAAQDHRLRVQIRELESQAKMIVEKEMEVRRLLATLQ